MNRTSMAIRSKNLALFASLAFLLASCTQRPNQEPVFPVHGKVLFEDKAAVGAIVWLHPVELVDEKDPVVLADVPRPRAVVEEDGSFHLSTYGTKDGAPVGRYYVAVFWSKTTGGGDDGGEDLLPARYQDAKNSGLPIIAVKSELNELPPFRLTR